VNTLVSGRRVNTSMWSGLALLNYSSKVTRGFRFTFPRRRPLSLAVPVVAAALLPLLPAADLLLAHLQEQRLLLVLVEGVQHVGVDVHVRQDLLQHGGGWWWWWWWGGGVEVAAPLGHHTAAASSRRF